MTDSAGQVPKTGTGRLLDFLDVKRAHFSSEATRKIYVELSPEGKTESDGDVVGRLKRSLYGTRDAPLNWELTTRKITMNLGFSKARVTPVSTFIRNEIFKLSFMEMISVQPDVLKVSSSSMKLLEKNGWLLSVYPRHQSF